MKPSPYIQHFFNVAMIFGAVALLSGWQFLNLREQRASIASTKSEVTVNQLIAGEFNDYTDFELTGHVAGDKFYYYCEENSDDFNIVYIPLFSSDAKQPFENAPRLIAGVNKVTCEPDLWKTVNKSSVSVRRLEPLPKDAEALAGDYPGIDWATIDYVEINPPKPPTIGAITLMGVLFVTSILIVGCVLAFTLSLKLRICRSKNTTFAALAESAEKSNRFSEGNTLGRTWTSELARHYFKYALKVSWGCGVAAFVCWILYRTRFIDTGTLTWVGGVALFGWMLLGASACLSRFFVSPKLEIKPIHFHEIPSQAQKKMETPIAELQSLGFQLIGHSKSTHFYNKYMAQLLSADQTMKAEIGVFEEYSYTVVSILTQDGLVLEEGTMQIPIDLDGTKVGVPVVANYLPNRTTGDVVSTCEILKEKIIANGDQLAFFPAESVFHFNHYEAILCDWHAYRCGNRFSMTESLPAISEVCQKVGGKCRFVFRRNPEMDVAFRMPERTADNASNPEQVITAQTSNELLQTATSTWK